MPSVATVGEWRPEPLDDRPLEAGYERLGMVWSPDGTKLVWDERFGGHVYLLDVGTGVTTELTTGGGRAPGVDWDRP